MTNLHADVPMKAHAYKNRNAVEDKIPYKRGHRKPSKAHTNTIALTSDSPWCMWAFGSRAKLMLKRQEPCFHALKERKHTF